MASGKFSVASSNQYITATAKWSSQKNTEGNYSVLSVELRASRTNSGYTTYGTGSGYIVVNGTKHSFNISSDQKITQNSNTLLGSVSKIKIPHNSDGTKELTIKVYATIPGAGLTIGESSGKITLDKIPRATTPTLSAEAVDMGNTVTINMARVSSSYTHALKYEFGGESGTLATNVGVSYTWDIPRELASQIPKSDSGICTITCSTYSGSVLIGTKTVKLTLSVPADMIPTITDVVLSDSTENVYAQFRQYLKDVSRLRIQTTAKGVCGSTISTISVKVLGITYNGSNVLTNVLTQAGEVVVLITVKDSRGRTLSLEKMITVTDYCVPMIELFTVTRATREGVVKSDGSCISCRVKFSITELNGLNAKQYKVEYRQTDESKWHTVLSGSVYTLDDTLLTEELFDPSYSYYIRLTVSDYFKSVPSVEIETGTGKPVWNIRSDKKGLAFGKVSEKQGFENDFTSWFYKELYVAKEDGTFLNVLDELLSMRLQKVLWSGSYQMDASQSISLVEKVSQQLHGIIVVFSAYRDGAVKDYEFSSHYIPKSLVSAKEGKGHSFLMHSTAFGHVAAKYLYIADGSISGNADNKKNGTANGITYDNSDYVLRYVYGI